ncbi:MAG: hypothetical protein L7H10_00460 [Vulcanisaeta sp.]|jgi:hypothetical protein|nr:hypothetical protein [Vulcanisaeta sp.]MCG2869198.1 hypothetical protein [Vulcanisaeta sp.]
MKVAIAGLNPGTAMYAYYMAKDGHEVTVYTGVRGDVVFMDLKPHASLGIVSRESTRLFTRRYLEDVLGIHIVNTDISSLIIAKNNEIVTNGRGNKYDRVIAGSEITPPSLGGCLSVYIDTPSPARYIINGRDPGKNLEISLLISEIGGSIILSPPLAIDSDLVKSLPINRAQAYDGCVTTDYNVVTPVITGDFTGETLGRGFVMRDPLSGLEYVVNRDYQLVIRGKLLALRDLGIIDSIPAMPRLEVGFSRDWSFLSIGLTREELGSAFRDVSSSRIAYHYGDGDIIGKVIHRGSRLLGLQLIVRGVRVFNWFYYIYSLVMLDAAAYLIVDMGYERASGTLRGLIEQLILDMYNI